MVFKTLPCSWVTRGWLPLAVAACGGSDLTLPSDGLPASLREISGSGQQARVGNPLPNPLIVRVTDAAGRPLPQVSLRFATQVPAAQIDPAQISTDDSGQAEVQVRLGTTEGTQTFDAELADAADLRTTFIVTALPQRTGDDGGGGDQGGGGEDHTNHQDDGGHSHRDHKDDGGHKNDGGHKDDGGHGDHGDHDRGHGHHDDD